ncbi:MAG: hypothetical protein P8P22_03425 [Porticoccaceae bacterium]|nr:hypothetical protein [Porticoccaceae bacterium]
MSSDNNQSVQDLESSSDSRADAIAAVAVLTIVIVTAVYWLSSL